MFSRRKSTGLKVVAITSFLIQLVISTAGAILTGVVVCMIPAILLAAVTKNNPGGNFIDHVGEQPVSVLFNEPYFVGPVVAGFLLGVFSRRRFQSSAGAWVWVVPMVILIFSVATWKTGGFRPYWRDVWDNYFGSHCGSSECAYELLVTLPFYTSVAYTLGWIAKGLPSSGRPWPKPVLPGDLVILYSAGGNLPTTTLLKYLRSDFPDQT